MSVLADKIEQFILHKLLEEDNSDILLRRNELADELQCAPSQISYVLSTRFSNDKGYLVESRRGSGGFVRIIKLTPKKQDRTPVLCMNGCQPSAFPWKTWMPCCTSSSNGAA